MASRRMPAIFFGHGNPMNALATNAYTRAWAAIGAAIPPPRAILAVSAHWYLPATLVTAMGMATARYRGLHDDATAGTEADFVIDDHEELPPLLAAAGPCCSIVSTPRNRVGRQSICSSPAKPTSWRRCSGRVRLAIPSKGLPPRASATSGV